MQQEPGKAPEAADLGQQLCCGVSWESSLQCWTLSEAAFTSVCTWRCPSLCYLRTSRTKDLIFSSNFSLLSFIQLSWTGCSAYVKHLIEHPGFLKNMKDGTTMTLIILPLKHSPWLIFFSSFRLIFFCCWLFLYFDIYFLSIFPRTTHKSSGHVYCKSSFWS